MTKIVCPKCGSKRIAENRWGKHIFTEKLFEDVEKGRVRIKKGKKKDSSGEYWCHRCAKNFCRAKPRYAPDTISRFKLSISSFSRGETSVEIYPVDKVIMAVIDHDRKDVIIPNRPALWISGKSWNAFTKKLIKDNLLLEWTRTYDNPSVVDGIQWSLEIDFSLSRRINWSGANQWPPYWNPVLRQLVKLLEKSLSTTDSDKVTQTWLKECIVSIEAGKAPKQEKAPEVQDVIPAE